MAAFFNKALDANEFTNLIHELPKETAGREVRRVTLKKLTLPVDILENIHFKHCKWDGVDASAKTIKNVVFENCEFTNVNMRDAQLINVQYIESDLNNVVMNKARMEQVKFYKSKLVHNPNPGSPWHWTMRTFSLETKRKGACLRSSRRKRMRAHSFWNSQSPSK